MVLNIEGFFNGAQLLALLQDNNPDAVLFSFNLDENTKKLEVNAQGIDKQANPLGKAVKGCPTPCHPPGGGSACYDECVDYWVSFTGESWQ